MQFGGKTEQEGGAEYCIIHQRYYTSIHEEADCKEAMSFKLVAVYTTITLKRELTTRKKHGGGMRKHVQKDVKENKL